MAPEAAHSASQGVQAFAAAANELPHLLVWRASVNPSRVRYGLHSGGDGPAMAKEKPAQGNSGPSGQAAAPPLPPGVKLLGTLEGHQNAVLCVVFDPQGGTLASGSADKTVKLWEARSGKLLRTLQGHKKRVWSVAFEPQGATLGRSRTMSTAATGIVLDGDLRADEATGGQLRACADPRARKIRARFE